MLETAASVWLARGYGLFSYTWLRRLIGLANRCFRPLSHLFMAN
jgi:hypothetical protein